MIAVAVAVIIGVVAVTCGIVADSNHADSLTFLGVMVRTTAAQIFLSGAICTWALFAALWLLSAGIRRSRERGIELRALRAATADVDLDEDEPYPGYQAQALTGTALRPGSGSGPGPGAEADIDADADAWFGHEYMHEYGRGPGQELSPEQGQEHPRGSGYAQRQPRGYGQSQGESQEQPNLSDTNQDPHPHPDANANRGPDPGSDSSQNLDRARDGYEASNEEAGNRARSSWLSRTASVEQTTQPDASSPIGSGYLALPVRPERDVPGYPNILALPVRPERDVPGFPNILALPVRPERDVPGFPNIAPNSEYPSYAFSGLDEYRFSASLTPNASDQLTSEPVPPISERLESERLASDPLASDLRESGLPGSDPAVPDPGAIASDHDLSRGLIPSGPDAVRPGFSDGTSPAAGLDGVDPRRARKAVSE